MSICNGPKSCQFLTVLVRAVALEVYDDVEDFDHLLKMGLENYKGNLIYIRCNHNHIRFISYCDICNVVFVFFHRSSVPHKFVLNKGFCKDDIFELVLNKLDVAKCPNLAFRAPKWIPKKQVKK